MIDFWSVSLWTHVIPNFFLLNKLWQGGHCRVWGPRTFFVCEVSFDHFSSFCFFVLFFIYFSFFWNKITKMICLMFLKSVFFSFCCTFSSSQDFWLLCKECFRCWMSENQLWLRFIHSRACSVVPRAWMTVTCSLRSGVPFNNFKMIHWFTLGNGPLGIVFVNARDENPPSPKKCDGTCMYTNFVHKYIQYTRIVKITT